jgi:transcriptional regulator with XRE-family HTH domain
LSPESNQALATLIAKHRKQQGLSREALSGLAGVSVSFIRDAEQDPSSCSLGKLFRVCAALGLKMQMHKDASKAWPPIFLRADNVVQSSTSSAGAIVVNHEEDSP